MTPTGVTPTARSLLLADAFLRRGGRTGAFSHHQLAAAAPFLGRPALGPRELAEASRELARHGLAAPPGPSDDTLSLTDAGRRRAAALYRAWAPLRFEELLAAAAGSPAYARHLAAVHPGAPAGSFGLVDGEQVRAIEDALAPLPETRVLELGAGNGGLARHLAGRGARVTAVDRAAGAMARLRRSARNLTGPGALNARVVDLDLPEAIEALAAAGPWDAVVAVDVLEFVAGFDGLFDRLSRSLADGGRLIVLGSTRWQPDERLSGPARLARVDLSAAELRFWERQSAGLDRWDEPGNPPDGAERDLLGVLRAEAATALGRAQRGESRRTLWCWLPV